MSPLEPASLEHIEAFAVSLALGLLIGLERERKPEPKAGLRTFALVSMFGCLSALIAEVTGNGWIVAIGLLAVAAMMIAAVTIDPPDDGDPPTTSIVALLITYGLGAAIWYGHGALAVMAAIATTALLYFKTQLHGITRALTHKDLISILQFAALSFVILPILPDTNFGPFDTINPHQIWWMVVLISGVPLAGYAALRIAGSQHGAPLIGLFGGMVSSTATTMVSPRHARADAELARTATVVILLANLMVMLRLLLVTGVVAPTLLWSLAIVFGPGIVFGLVVAAIAWRGHADGPALPMPEVSNPTELKTALTFGALYAFVLILSAWLQDIAGSRGLYAVALASGLTDVDAITLSSLRLHNQERLAEVEAVMSIVLATLSNLAFKSGLVVSIGGAPLARRTLPGLAAIAIGTCVGLLVFLA
jgi:uncharacterized membrane protein (DUF4010 family)